MVLLNNYFHNDKLANEGTISVSGKLEAFIGNYFVSGEGCPGETVLLIYYDPKIDSYYNAVECIKENLVNAFPFGAVTAVCIILTIIKSMTSPIWPTMTATVTPKAPKNVPTFDEFSLYS